MKTFLCSLLVGSASAHSWLDCVDYDCPAAAPGAGPQPPAACTCKGYPRNWATVMAGVPFAADRGRDNRPGAAPDAGGLFCDTGKEPDPGAGTGIPAGLYSAEYPMASLAKGQNVRWRWPAKNHANTPAAGTVEVFISSTPNTGDTFNAASPHIAQMSYSSDGGDCLGLATSTDTADCQGTWQVPTTLAEGRYTLMWWWEFNAGEFYNTCADVFITAAEGDAPVGDASPPPVGGGGGGTPANPVNERTVVKVVMTVEGDVASFDGALRSRIAQGFATATGIPVGNIVVSVAAGYGVSAAGDGSVDVAVDMRTGSAQAALTAVNVLGASLATPQEATAVLAGAGVTVLRVQQVETVFPSQISTDGSVAEERDGWRASTLAFVALLVMGGAVVYFKFIKPQEAAAPAGKAAASSTPMVAVNPGGRAQPTPPPPGQVPPAQLALPPGWAAHADPASGHTYYVSATGESTWSHPGATISPV